MKSAEDRLDQAVRDVGGKVLPDASLQALAQAARAELLARPKARPWWVDALLLLALNLVMGGGAAAAMSWSDAQHASMTTRSVVALAWLLVMSLGSVLWLKPGSTTGRWLVGLSFLTASLLAVGGASGFDPGMPFMMGVGCALTECAIALVPTGVMLLLSLRFAARPIHIFTGTLAVASGGALALHLHCSNGTVAHLVAFHLLPAVVLGLGAVGVRRVIRSHSHVP